MKIFIFFIMFLSSVCCTQSEIVINEIMSSNTRTIRDTYGETSDWIELYNTSDTSVDISNYALSDNDDKANKWLFPDGAFIGGKDYLLVFASGRTDFSGYSLHCNFKISSDGEPILLSDNSGELLDRFEPRELNADISYGRIPDGSDAKRYFVRSSPGRSNNVSDTSSAYRETISFSRPAGIYYNDFKLGIETDRKDVQIRYTLNGSTPTISSSLYIDSLLLTKISDRKNSVSMIKTSRFWKKPKGDVYKINTVRAAVFDSVSRLSPIYTRSYIVDSEIHERYKFPIISIVSDSLNFFDPGSGIYVAGNSYRDDDPDFSGNYYMRGDSWERPVHFEYFDQSGKLAVAQELGARIHGNMSRRKPQKSLKLYARKEYGKKYLEYKFFPELDISKFKRLVLRTPTPDDYYNNVMFKDEICHKLMRGILPEIQESRAVIVVLNGEYWGIQHLKERVDQYYLAAHFNVDPDSLSILERNALTVAGDPYDYLNLITYIRNNDMSDEQHYQYARDHIDIENFINYMTAELYFANFDWPMGNIKFWKADNPGAKWRWIFYDTDRGFIRHSIDYIREYLSPEVKYNIHPEWSVFLLRSLMQNSGFRSKFYAAFIEHINSNFAPNRVIEEIDRAYNELLPHVAEHIRRWGEPVSMDNWKQFVKDMKTFAVRRPLEITRQLDKLFGSPVHLFPNPADSELEIYLENIVVKSAEVSVYDMDSKQYISRSLEFENSRSKLPVSLLAPGQYLVCVRIGTMIFSNKLIISR